ncbi:class I SAM-dependent methyltransferase [Aliikangiella marina]|uniref:class I SAM-dependent methyltransferase n=1 Tax=Aliikangiella marina TaxID=1712262 RepID=UPI00163D8BB3|nr:class I SAM-dependent methyltransferase [Aliikangiella marina]
MFKFLSHSAPSTDIAWDCATGSGQSAISLKTYFKQVFATDASEQQIANAKKLEGIEYRVAVAENSGLATGSCDLICVAQAAHWFDLNQFYKECDRVSKPDCLVALWCYQLFSISPAIDELVFRLYSQVLGDFWPAERRLVEDGYASMPFPYKPLATPKFSMTKDWDLNTVMGYLSSWSACHRYQASTGESPLTSFSEEMSKLWGPSDQIRSVNWPLHLKVGVVK